MSKRWMWFIVGALVIVLAIGAGAMLARPGVSAGAEDRPAAPASSIPGPAVRARADLAARLGVAADKIAVDGVRAETWNDASLGLPEPGMMYAQVITAGDVVTLSYGGKSYVYHVAGETVKLEP